MMEDKAIQPTKDPRDKWIPRYFFIFFGFIALLDGFFVYTAISTQTGLVTQNPYEKGIAYNEMLNKAHAQPALEQKVTYDNTVLRWALPIENASVTASIMRPVQEGFDFDVVLNNSGNGIYEATLQTPMPGAWTAKMKARWDNQEFQTTYSFIVP